MNVAKDYWSSFYSSKAPGGCVIVRDREIIGDGRSFLLTAK